MSPRRRQDAPGAGSARPRHLADVDAFRAWWASQRAGVSLHPAMAARMLDFHRWRYRVEHPRARVPRDWPSLTFAADHSAATREAWRARLAD